MTEAVQCVITVIAPSFPPPGISRFTIAAAFGNVHGVYKAGNVVLKPEILQDHPRFFTSNMDEVDTFQNQSRSVLFSRHDPAQVSGKLCNSD